MSRASVEFGQFVYGQFRAAGVSTSGGDSTKFANRILTCARKRTQDAEALDEAIHAVVVKMLSGQMSLRPGATLLQAEQFVTVSLIHAAIDASRKAEACREDVCANPIEETETVEDHGFAVVEDSDMLNELLNDLSATINPRARDWVEQQLNDHSKVELAESWGVTAPAVGNFENRYLGKIQAVAAKYLTS